jgi:hypothetical protein
VPTVGGKAGIAGDRPSNRRTYKPTPEQEQAVELFGMCRDLKINAYAGTGKTSTLELLSHSTSRRGQYLAFNRDIVADAKRKFPKTVGCATTHSLAFKSVAPRFDARGPKLTGRMNANQIAGLFRLEKWKIDGHHVLQPRSQGFLILDTVRRFAMSADPEPLPEHVPEHGSLSTASDSTVQAVKDFAVRGAKQAWARMCNPNDAMPLGHDGYLKLWALSTPVIAADFILLDEAQDTSPVVLDVLKNQQCQIVYVGDKYQQIYEWRGAQNAMEKMAVGAETFLTTSFRFGQGIADTATKLLVRMGEVRPLLGNPALTSRMGPTPNAGTILSRTNASTISAVIDALESGLRPHLVGGTDELMKMLEGVADLKNGEPSTVPDFFGFSNWKEVVEFTRCGEGAHLQTFVNLVEKRGEKQLMWALRRTVDQEGCDQVISTAHRAKGREWPTVRLTDDFLKSRPKRRPGQDGAGEREADNFSELRLLYVAMTRARDSIEVPPPLLELLNLPLPQRQPEIAVPRPDAIKRPSQRDELDARASSFPGSSTRVPAQPESGMILIDPLIPQAKTPTRREETSTHIHTEPAAPSIPSPIYPEHEQPRRKGFFRWLFGR